MKNEKLQCKQARDILITGFLKRSGFSPRREDQQEAWYLSPLRNEAHPSFKVSKPLNRWYDHGLGRGGNVIDLVIEMNNHCTVQQALSILSRDIPSFSFQQQNSFAVLKPKDEIKIEKVLPLKHPELILSKMFDFFSLLTLYPGLPLKSDFLILNSLSFVDRIVPTAESYSKTCLYLDNDPSGKKATQKLLEKVKGSVDLSGVYASKKDLNELLVTSRRRFRTGLR